MKGVAYNYHPNLQPPSTLHMSIASFSSRFWFSLEKNLQIKRQIFISLRPKTLLPSSGQENVAIANLTRLKPSHVHIV